MSANECKINGIVRILGECLKHGRTVSYPNLRTQFMLGLGLVSRYAFDNWIIYCVAKGYLKPVGDSVRVTGNKVVYEIFDSVVGRGISD